MRKKEEILNECLKKYRQELPMTQAQKQCFEDAMNAARAEEEEFGNNVFCGIICAIVVVCFLIGHYSH